LSGVEVSAIPSEPPRELRFRRRLSLADAFRELWRARELIRTMAERELRARYKQAYLGFAWAVIPPVIYMVVFSTFFELVADIDTGGVPYSIFVYVGLLPWTFFSSAVLLGGMSLVVNLSLLNKVYCPREVFPIASTSVAAFDTAVATCVLGLLFVINTFVPKATAVYVPVLILVQLAFTLGVGLLTSAVMVYVRDLRHALPVALQVGLFATPVAYGLDAIPPQYRPLYSLLNPLAPVIDGYRRAVLFGEPPQWGLLGLGAITAGLLLFGGYWLFKRLETGFADVA
jgi:ABC-type polysaccharide/polyol phosphate export permease